jgi:N-alpha-acetyltransferase 15/16, NatA auxiliary subunit
MAIPENRQLGKKEADLFKSVINFYETKQHKKGLKAADAILKKYPNHGETQAMKGLITNALGNKEEALELVKLGVRNDMRSHITWHVYGLYHRSNHNYKEGLKCYLNALRMDKENQQILRDLSHMQIQVRDLAGFVESRRQLLVLRPKVKANWICFAVAQFKAGNYSEANGIVNNYLTNTDTKEDSEFVVPYEQGELLLFQNRCLEADKKYDEALKHLNKNERAIPDKLSVRVKRAELMCLLGDHHSARRMWFLLVEEQPMNYRFHCGYQIALLELDFDTTVEMLALERHNLPCTALSLSPLQTERLVQIYTEKLTPSQPGALVLLGLYEGDLLREKLTEFLQKGITRGFPALYNDVCSLIMIPDVVGGNPSRKVYATDASDLKSHPIMTLVLQIVDGFIANLTSNGTFESTPGAESVTAVPTCLMWALFLRCHLFGMLGRLPEALADIEAAIAHTPTSLDCLYKRARILKLCGDIQGAAVAMDYCRSLDLQDRYVNNKATKYFLRADKIPEAKETIALFTKHDGDPEQSLHYIQCIWYAQETGESYMRLDNGKQALKKFYAVESFFNDFMVDLFDFHSFSIRKSTLRAYLDAMENLDGILAHPSYQASARCAVKVLLNRIDNPTASVEEVTVDFSKMSASEKKKEKAKQRKLKNKLEAEKAAKEQEAVSKEKESGGKSHFGTDEDPNGDKLWEKDPMEEAVRWARRMIEHTSQSPDSYDLVCDVMMRSADHLVAMQCLQSGLLIEPSHAGLTLKLMDFAKKFQSGSLELKPEDEEVIRGQLQSLKCDTPELLTTYREDFIARVTRGECSLLHRVAAAKCVLMFDAAATQQAAALLTEEKLWTEKGITFKKCVEAHQIISKDLGVLAGVADGFKAQIAARYPLSQFSGHAASENFTGVVEGEATE